MFRYMQEANELPGKSQHQQLKVKFNSEENPYLSTDIQKKYSEPRKLSSYFIVLIESGSITYKLDLQEFTLTDGNLLFAIPNQVLTPPCKEQDLKYFKVTFDDNTLALLPQQFPFLVNPLNSQTIVLTALYDCTPLFWHTS
jgi:AraC family transcriptional regulator, transcriptional activator of pobA